MKRALIVYGGWDGHDPRGVSALFERVLRAEDFEVTLSDSQEILLRELSGYDLFIPIWTMGVIAPEAERSVMAAVENGMGLAGCHGGMCDAFRQSTDWQFMTGAQWVAHPGGDGVRYRVNIRRSSDSEIVRGIGDFDVTSEQYYIHVDPVVNVLATTRFPVIDGPHAANGEVDVPVVYTKRWGRGRVFYNSLGHTSRVFETPEALEIMRRGFIWAARGEKTE